ncbi:MAG: PAS domain S-box protein [Desulfobaccales bacterium]
MTKNRPPANTTADLRARAERFLAKTGPDGKKIPAEDVQRLVHELQVQQVELEMQHQELRRAQETIEEARSRYEALYDFAPVGYFTLSRKGKIIQANLTGAGLLGVKRSLLIDQPFHLRLAPEFREAFRAHLQKVFEAGGQQTCELKVLRPDGTHLHVLMESTTQPDAKEAQGQCHAVITDITDRKQTKKELCLKERLLDGACDSIFLHDLDGHFLYLNEAAYSNRGYEKEELLAKDVSELVTPEFAGKREALLNDLMAKGEVIFESAHRRKDGSVLPVEIHARTINISDQQLILSVARDITDRKEAQEALRKSEETYRQIVETALEGIWTIDAANRVTFANNRLMEMLGYSQDELLGQPITKLLDREWLAKASTLITEHLRKGNKEHLDFKLRHRDGRELWMIMTASPIFDAQGPYAGALGMVTDITARKQAEEALRESEQRFRDITEHAVEWIWEVDPEGKYTYSSLTVEKLLGYTPEEVLGKHFYDFFLPEDREELKRAALAAFGAKQPFRDFLNRNLRKDGETVWLSTSGVPVLDAAGNLLGYRGVDNDITARKQAEDSLRESEENYRLLVNQIPAVVFKGYADWSIDFFDNKIESITGYSKTDFDSRKLRWQELILPEDLEEAKQKFIKALKTDKSYVREYRIRRKDGEIRWVQNLGRIFCDAGGKIDHVSGVLLDINARKKAEEVLRAAAHKWRVTFDAIGDAVFLTDFEAKILTCNQAMVDLVKRPFPEIIGRHYWELVHGTAAPIDGCPWVRMRKSGKRETLTVPFGDRWFYSMVDPILNEAGEVTGAVHIIADITEHQRILEQINNLNVILTAIKDMNETLLRAKSEPELFQHICDLMLKIPYNRFTWIGLVEPGNFEVKPVAWAGHEDGYLSVIKVTWDDSRHGRGPTGTAIKTGQPGIVEDIENDPRFRPWRRQAQQRGYASCIAFPLIHEGKTLGSLNVYAEKKNAFQAEGLKFLNQVAGDIAVGVKSLRLEQELAQRLIQVQVMMFQTIEAIASMAELRDPYTAGHQQKVTLLALALAQETGLAPDRTEGLRVASIIHDIGKIVVPAEILSKPGEISDYEVDIIKTHSQAGYDILNKIDFPWPVAQIVLQHHERLDGSGYPQGLKGSDILQEAKILAVADVVEAMASHRPYRPALGIDKALAEIIRGKGVLYDPETVDVCVTLFTEKRFSLD